ncbi:hypothetical protein [Thermococcus sp.]|uniref:hypothetical protein n=1 Tax=Thermococcus sp. TaxID=35749 RepID=UPI0025E0C7C1|nr:hypothetical protein [Thermococcus sp.]
MEGVEYIYDEQGRIKGVIIPLELWERIKGGSSSRQSTGVFTGAGKTLKRASRS